jgi:hypothetical protein
MSAQKLTVSPERIKKLLLIEKAAKAFHRKVVLDGWPTYLDATVPGINQ